MSNIATLHPKYTGLAILPTGESVTTMEAIERGFKIEGAQPTSRSVSTSISVPNFTAPSYAAQISALPEAINRQAAAAQLAADHTINSLPLKAAASLLRGLPTEGE